MFPAYYDRCYATALALMLDGWSDFQIVPRFGWCELLRVLVECAAVLPPIRGLGDALGSPKISLLMHYLVVARK